MEKNLNLIAKELFDKIRSQFPGLSLGNQEGKVTDSPEEARFFKFSFKKNGVDLGFVNVALEQVDDSDDYTSDKLTVIFSNDILRTKESASQQWYNFLRELREFAKQRLLDFDVRDVTKTNLDKRDYEHMANKHSVQESKLYGTGRSSYQDVGEAKIIVKHTQAVTAESAHRARYIDSIYVENTQGERFKYPYKHLNGARAMARHVANGGIPYDLIGEHIIGLSEELGQLRKFKGYVSRNEAIAESLNDIPEKVNERINSIKKEISSLQSQANYSTFAESFEKHDTQDLPEDIVNDWVEKLTIKTFNEELKSVFPYIYKLVGENSVTELSYKDLVSGEKCVGEECNLRKTSVVEEEAFEAMLTAIVEGAGLFGPDDQQQAAIQQLNDLLATEFTVGVDGANAIESLSGIIDDEELFDVLRELADINPQSDVKPILKDYVKIKDEEHGTDVLSQLNFDQEPEATPEEPAPTAPQPAPAPTAAPAPQPAPAPTAAPAPQMAGLDPTGFSETTEELAEFVSSMFDKETGNFPKGETGVLIAVEKKFGESAVGLAEKVMSHLKNISEGYRLKKLAGIDKDENVTELSKGTLGSYIKKATSPSDERSISNLSGRAAAKLMDPDGNDDGTKDDEKSFKRSKGIARAVSKLSAESVITDIMKLAGLK